MRSRSSCWALAFVACGLTGCLMYDGEGPDRPVSIGQGAPVISADGGAQDAGSLDKSRPSHLPCEVEALIRTRCAGCHAPSSLPHRPISLLTYEEFARPSLSAPGLSYAQQAAQLLESGMMPPTAALPPAEVRLFATWVQAGAPAAECGADASASDAGNPLDAAEPTPADAGSVDAHADAAPAQDAGGAADAGDSRCHSGSYWRSGEVRSPLMHPGRACISCHAMGAGFLNLQHGPNFSAAGTLYSGAHEPDDCNGAGDPGVALVIVDATMQRLTLTPNRVGNFTTLNRITMPYRAEIQYQGRSRTTLTPHQSGDCNACHSKEGTQGAAGRLQLP